MPITEIYQQLGEILQSVFDDDTIVATPELTAASVPGWDSLAHLRVMFTVERTFGVNFAASQLSQLNNVGDLAALVESKLAAKQA